MALTMERAMGLFLHAAALALPGAGDRLVEVVHRAVTGEPLRGDPKSALDALVDRQMLTPQAALYVAGFRQALHEVAQAVSEHRKA